MDLTKEKARGKNTAVGLIRKEESLTKKPETLDGNKKEEKKNPWCCRRKISY